jgi:hypothetical protein
VQVQRHVGLVAHDPAVVAGRHVEHVARPSTISSPSSIFTAARPERTSPMCSTAQLFVPAMGPTCLDQCQPGWYSARPSSMPPG